MRNKSTVLRWSGRAAVVIGVLAVAIYLALTSLYDTHAPVVTTLLFLLVTGIVAIALTSQFPLWLVLPELLLGLGFLAALAGSWPEPTAGALASVLRSPALWGTLAIVAGGMALLAALERWPRAARRWLWLLTYLVASGGLAAWWYWGPARSQLAALPHLSQLDHQALAYLPAVLAIGTGAQLLLGLLIPHGAWRKAAIADLTATLVLMLAPVTAQVLPQRTPLPFEGTFHIAWLAAFLILLVVLRAAVAFAFLLGAARDWVQPGRKRDERRLALALLVLCLLVYWPVGLWRSSALGLTGDEPQYLAATMSLWQHHNLELTDGMFSGWMAEHVFDRENDLRVDIYEDQKADRMLFSRAWGTPRQTIYLPLVGGDQTATTIELLNPNLESASAQITYRDDKGTDVTTQQVTIAPGATAVLPAVQGAGQQLSAAIEAAKPVLAAALVGGQAGRELYFGGVALPRQCIPVHLDDR
ncbi:MAG TPA: hypothetical protein VFU78_05770, partial [Thermomicrobiales bacterium]|nr:hypothetical protein [Thermomicrobiales bacterium]